MKLAFFSDVYFPFVSGVSVSIENFARGLVNRGHEVYLFTADRGRDCQKALEFPGFHVIPLKSSERFSSYPGFTTVGLDNIFTINAALKEIQPHIIHVHTPTLFALLGNYCSYRFKIPLVSTYHTYLPDVIDDIYPLNRLNRKLATSLLQFYTKLHYNRVHHIVTPSPVIGSQLKKLGIQTSITTISNGIHLPLFRMRPYGSQTNPAVRYLHVGRLSHEKNIPVVLKAFQRVAATLPDVHLSIIGSGPEESNLKKEVQALGLEDQVEFLGKIPHAQLPIYYQSHDVFVTASTFETEGLVILEAMACGLPVVGVDYLAIPHLVQTGHNGFLSPAFDVESMAQHLIQLGKDEHLRQRLGTNGRKIAEQYDLEVSLNKMEKLYKSLCDGIAA